MDTRQRLDEDLSNWGGATSRYSTWFYPIGKVGRFFSKFFSKQGAQAVASQITGEDDGYPSNAPKSPAPVAPLAGDTVVKPDVIKGESVFAWDRTRLPVFPQQEIDRKYRYRQFEDMDDYPEIGSAFDIYADDCTQQNLNGTKWQVITEEVMVKDEIERLFDDIHLENYLWDIVRNTVKFGDCFIELVVDLNNITRGVQRIKVLNPNFLYRVEDEFGYLTSFLQEIPVKGDWTTMGNLGAFAEKAQVVPLDKAQIVHFRLFTSDPTYYPYGKSVAAVARHIYRSLKLMEDAMLIYRLSRAPERRIFYIDTGNLPANKAQSLIEKQMEKFKKTKLYNYSTGNIEANYNPLSADEDFYVAVNGKGSGTKIDTLPGAQNLGEVDDVKYFRDKLLAALKIPKDYIVEKDQSPERKANLSQLDVKFARVIGRIQRAIEIGLETIAHRHLQIKGYPYSMVSKTKIKLPEPSDMAKKRMLDLDEQKARVVAAVKGLGIFPIEKIYKDYYELTDMEIDELKKQMEDQMEDPVFGPMAMGMPGGAPPMDPMMGGPPGAPPMAGPGPMEAGGQEGMENIPPTQIPETVVNTIDNIFDIIPDGNDNLKSVLSEVKSYFEKRKKVNSKKPR